MVTVTVKVLSRISLYSSRSNSCGFHTFFTLLDS